MRSVTRCVGRQFSYDLTDAEARRLLPWREFLEALQPVRDVCLGRNQREGALEPPADIVHAFPVSLLERIAAQSEQLRHTKLKERVLPDIEALGPLWRGLGQRPALGLLGGLAAAEVLLRAGAISGWLASARQVEGVQDAAKDLLSESIARFLELGQHTKAAEAQLCWAFWPV